MFPIIIRGVLLGAVGYGIAKILEEECECDCEKYNYDDDEEDEDEDEGEKNMVTKFYNLKQSVLDNSYKELYTILSNVNGINLEDLQEVSFKNNFPQDNEYIDEINIVADNLIELLESSDKLIKQRLSDISNITKISNNYDSYTEHAKKLLDDSVKLLNLTNNILNVKLINKKDKPSKSSKQLIIDVKGIIENMNDYNIANKESVSICKTF